MTASEVKLKATVDVDMGNIEQVETELKKIQTLLDMKRPERTNLFSEIASRKNKKNFTSDEEKRAFEEQTELRKKELKSLEEDLKKIEELQKQYSEARRKIISDSSVLTTVNGKIKEVTVEQREQLNIERAKKRKQANKRKKKDSSSKGQTEPKIQKGEVAKKGKIVETTATPISEKESTNLTGRSKMDVSGRQIRIQYPEDIKEQHQAQLQRPRRGQRNSGTTVPQILRNQLGNLITDEDKRQAEETAQIIYGSVLGKRATSKLKTSSQGIELGKKELERIIEDTKKNGKRKKNGGLYKRAQDKIQKAQEQIGILDESHRIITSDTQASSFNEAEIKEMERIAVERVKKIFESMADTFTQMEKNFQETGNSKDDVKRLKNTIRESVVADVLSEFNTDLIQVPDRKTKTSFYEEGVPKEKEKSVLTARNFSSFSVNGEFVPGSYQDEDGQRHFSKSYAVKSDLLKNPKNILNLGNLSNASLTQLSQIYQRIQEAPKQTQGMLDLASNIENAIIEAIKNTNDGPIKQAVIDQLSGIVQESYQDAQDRFLSDVRKDEATYTEFNKQGQLFDIVRQETGISASQKFNENLGDIEGQPSQDKWEDDREASELQSALSQLRKTTEALAISEPRVIQGFEALESVFDKFVKEGKLQDFAELLEASIEQFLSLINEKNESELIRTREKEMYGDAYMETVSSDAPIFKDDDRSPTFTDNIQDTDSNFDEIEDTSESMEQTSEDLKIKANEIKLGLEQALSGVSNLVENDLGVTEETKPKAQEAITTFLKNLKYLDDETLLKYEPLIDILDNAVEGTGSLTTSIQTIEKINMLFGQLKTEEEKINGQLQDYKKPTNERGELETSPIETGLARKTLRNIESTRERNEDIDVVAVDNTEKQLTTTLTESLNRILEKVRAVRTGEAREIENVADGLISKPIDLTRFYNTISNFLEFSAQVDYSLQDYVNSINGKKGADVLNIDSVRNEWMSRNPEMASRYTQSKSARERFDKAGGMDNIDSAFEAFFNSQDELIENYKRKWDKLGDSLISVSNDEDGNPIKEKSQGYIKRNVMYRLDSTGKYTNPDAMGAKKHYKSQGIQGQKLDKEFYDSLSYALKTQLAHKAGLTGTRYGGYTIADNLANAKKLLAEKQKQLNELYEGENDLLDIEIQQIQEDIKILESAQKPKEFTSKSKRKSKSEIKAERKDKAKKELERRQQVAKEKGIKDRYSINEDGNFVNDVIGDYITHKAFGKGRILKSQKGRSSVKFDNGQIKMFDNKMLSQILTDFVPTDLQTRINDAKKDLNEAVAALDTLNKEREKAIKEIEAQIVKKQTSVERIKRLQAQGMTGLEGKLFEEEKEIKVLQQKKTDILSQKTPEYKRQTKRVDEANKRLAQLTKGLSQEEVVKTQQKEEQKSLQDTAKIAKGEHTEGIEVATEAEKQKIIVSKELADVLGKEAQAHKDVVEASEDEEKKPVTNVQQLEEKVQQKNTQTQYPNAPGKLDKVEVFKPKYDDNLHKYWNEDGEEILSITQARDILMGRGSSSWKADTDNLKQSALNGVTTAESMNMNQKDFDYMAKSVAQGLFGNAFHSAVEQMIKAGPGVRTLSDLEKANRVAYNEQGGVGDQIKDAFTAIKNLGLDLEKFDIDSLLQGYWDVIDKSGMTPQQFQEQVVGLRMYGNKGKVEVGLQPDQSYLMENGVVAMLDNKTGNPHHAGLQLTAAGMVAKYGKGSDIANLDDLAQSAVNGIKTFIVDVKTGVVQLIENTLLGEDLFYDLTSEAYRKNQTGESKYTPERAQEIFDSTEMKTNRIRSEWGEEIAQETREPISNPTKEISEINKYFALRKQIAKEDREILELQEQQLNTDADGAKKIQEKINAIKRLRDAHEDLLAQTDLYNVSFDQTTGENVYTVNDGNSTIDGGILGSYKLTDNGVEYFNKKLEEYQAFENNRQVDLSRKDDKVDSERQLNLIKQYINAQEEYNKLLREEERLKLELEKADESGKDIIQKQLKENSKAQNRERDKLIDVENSGLDVNNGTYTDLAGNLYNLTLENAQYLADEQLRIRREDLEAKKKLHSQEVKAQQDKDKEVENEQKKATSRYLKLLKERHDKEVEILKLAGKNAVIDRNTEQGNIEWQQNTNLIKQYREQIRQTDAEFENLNQTLSQTDALNDDVFRVENNRYQNERQKTINDNRVKYGNYQAGQQKIKDKVTNTSIKEYLNSFKKYKQVERDIAQQEFRLNNVDGTIDRQEVRNIQQYLDILKRSKTELEARLRIYNEETGELNGQKLTQEQLAKIEIERNKIADESQVKMAKMQAGFKAQIPLVDQLFGAFKNVMENVSVYGMAQRVFNSIEDSFRNIIEYAKELDKAIVNIQIASGMKRGETISFVKDLNDLGNQLGMTTQELAAASNDWLRAGYKGKEVVDLTEASATLAQLGMIDTADATSYLISSLKGWKLEASEVMDVVSKLTAVDMSAALSAGELAEAIYFDVRYISDYINDSYLNAGNSLKPFYQNRKMKYA